jgi:hypothetical protein
VAAVALEFATMRPGSSNLIGSRVGRERYILSAFRHLDGASSANKKTGASRALDFCELKISGDQK